MNIKIMLALLSGVGIIGPSHNKGIKSDRVEVRVNFCNFIGAVGLCPPLILKNK